MSILALPLALTAGDCKTTDSSADGGATGEAGAKTDAGDASVDAGATIACYVGNQFRCKEIQNPSESQQTNLPIECSSVSGDYGTSCPRDNFGGKCTVAADTGPKDSPEIRRFYTGRDLAYEQDFCVNTAHGVWSTTF
ncbi:MAG: hypothetical protein U0235_14250 [Polyangiaceae bacterium]